MTTTVRARALMSRTERASRRAHAEPRRRRDNANHDRLFSCTPGDQSRPAIRCHVLSHLRGDCAVIFDSDRGRRPAQSRTCVATVASLRPGILLRPRAFAGAQRPRPPRCHASRAEIREHRGRRRSIFRFPLVGILPACRGRWTDGRPLIVGGGGRECPDFDALLPFQQNMWPT